jgi:hypothetical protein
MAGCDGAKEASNNAGTINSHKIFFIINFSSAARRGCRSGF